MVKCKNCWRRKTLRLNLLKKENAPRVYFVECGLCPSPDYESDCPYYEDIKKHIWNYLTKKLKLLK